MSYKPLYGKFSLTVFFLSIGVNGLEEVVSESKDSNEKMPIGTKDVKSCLDDHQISPKNWPCQRPVNHPFQTYWDVSGMYVLLIRISIHHRYTSINVHFSSGGSSANFQGAFFTLTFIPVLGGKSIVNCNNPGLSFQVHFSTAI